LGHGDLPFVINHFSFVIYGRGIFFYAMARIWR
jgi:hypothetical protein